MKNTRRDFNRRIFSADEIETAKGMRARGVTWLLISQTFRCDRETIKRLIEPGYAETRALQIREASRNRRVRQKPVANQHTGLGPHKAVRTPVPPAELLIERDAALTAPVTLTAILCGDPPPGRSALDKRSQQRSNLTEPHPMTAGFKVGLSQ